MSQDLDMYYIIYIWVVVMGIILSTQLFKVAMKIRADRKAYSIAMVLVGEVFAIGVALCFYGVGQLIELIRMQVPRLGRLHLIGSGELGEILFSYTLLIAIGLLLGAISNMMSTRISIGLGIVLLVLVCYSQLGDTRSFLIMVQFFQRNVLVGLGTIGISVVITIVVMLKCPLEKVSKTFRKRGDLCE